MCAERQRHWDMCWECPELGLVVILVCSCNSSSQQPTNQAGLFIESLDASVVGHDGILGPSELPLQCGCAHLSALVVLQLRCVVLWCSGLCAAPRQHCHIVRLAAAMAMMTYGRGGN
jgi:hypothetical protein